MEKKKIVLFKSPTCGPCKLFAPVCKQVAEQVQVEYEEIDVTTESGLAIAKQYNISHSGCALYIVDNEVKITWERPVPPAKMLADLG
jgi:thiol-disulfide isomerase/thioredoxin